MSYDVLQIQICAFGLFRWVRRTKLGYLCLYLTDRASSGSSRDSTLSLCSAFPLLYHNWNGPLGERTFPGRAGGPADAAIERTENTGVRNTSRPLSFSIQTLETWLELAWCVLWRHQDREAPMLFLGLMEDLGRWRLTLHLGHHTVADNISKMNAFVLT